MSIVSVATGQSPSRYITREGIISFYSDAPLEKIEAHNKKAAAAFETLTGNFQIVVLMQAFMFEKDLMQQHFNENYVESHKYPKALFKGIIENISQVNFEKDGEYPVTVSGTMEIHGVTREVKTTGTLRIEGERVTAISDFMLRPEDYNIKIPKLVSEKIAREIKVSVHLPMTKRMTDKEGE
jgi:hypothetical protein